MFLKYDIEKIKDINNTIIKTSQEINELLYELEKDYSNQVEIENKITVKIERLDNEIFNMTYIVSDEMEEFNDEGY